MKAKEMYKIYLDNKYKAEIKKEEYTKFIMDLPEYKEIIKLNEIINILRNNNIDN